MSRLEPELVEFSAIPQTFCDGLASVEISANGLARLIFFAEQRSTGHTDNRIERVIVDRLVIPQVALIEAAAKILSATDDGPRQSEWPVHMQGGRA